MKRVLLGAVLALALSGPALADFAEGAAAYRRGDFATALKEWLPLAQSGDVAAANNVGLIYVNGEGVKQDFVEAAKWFRSAAERGNGQIGRAHV